MRCWLGHAWLETKRVVVEEYIEGTHAVVLESCRRCGRADSLMSGDREE